MSTSEGKYTGARTKADLDNHSDTCNPNNPKYKGYDRHYGGTGDKPDLDNHSRQKDPKNPRYQAPKK